MKNIHNLKPLICIAVIVSALVYIATSGSSCEELISNPPVPDALKGNWKLVLQTGAQQDICTDETVNFQDNGIAILACPNSQQISRQYTVSNDVLTYTETSVDYDVVFSNNQQTLELKGKNVSRNLTYSKQTSATAETSRGNESSTTSSDLPKEVAK